MTSLSFCKWVNEDLLPNRVLEPEKLDLKLLESDYIIWNFMYWIRKREFT